MKIFKQQLLGISFCLIALKASLFGQNQNPYRPVARSTPPTLRESESYQDHFFDARVGPRIAFAGGKVRPGLAGSSLLDFKDDLGLDDPALGAQFELEMRVAPEWRAMVNFNTTTFDGPNKVTNRTLTYQSTTNPPRNPNTQANPAILAQGSTISAEVTLQTFSGLIEYEVYKDKKWIVAPTLGLKFIHVDETFVINNIGNSITSVDNTEVDEITPLVGVNVRYYINKDLYLGISPAMFGGEKYIYLTGQAFAGYDFAPQNWGAMSLRLGVDADQIWNNHSGDGSARYDIEATVLAAFIEVGYGF
jgi:hypothetical protein